MRLMCAMLVFEWRFELASVFALFRERSFQKDTIPKPGGLGFGRRALRVFCPVVVRLLSGTCPASVRCMLMRFCEAVEDKFQDILSKVDQEVGALPPGTVRRIDRRATRAWADVSGYLGHPHS